MEALKHLHDMIFLWKEIWYLRAGMKQVKLQMNGWVRWWMRGCCCLGLVLLTHMWPQDVPPCSQLNINHTPFISHLYLFTFFSLMPHLALIVSSFLTHIPSFYKNLHSFVMMDFFLSFQFSHYPYSLSSPFPSLHLSPYSSLCLFLSSPVPSSCLFYLSLALSIAFSLMPSFQYSLSNPLSLSLYSTSYLTLSHTHKA